MQVTNQAKPNPQYNCNYNCGNATNPAVPQAPAVVQQQVQAVPNQAVPQQTQMQYQQQAPQMQYQQTPAPQNYQVPATASGVNIQIFNPSVLTPGAQPPAYNVNAPCYPSNYYTGQFGPSGSGGVNNGNINNGTNNGTMGNNNNNTITTTNNNNTTTSTSEADNKKKTEKKKIVQLTDDYIRNLENYLNSQEKEVRLNAAKEVYARLEEDESRKDDKALTALINKMLQDPMQEVRLLALTALEGRIVTGDDYTVGLLNKMQSSKDGYGQDALDASKILLKMSGKEVEKEVPVKENKKENKKAEAKDKESK